MGLDQYLYKRTGAMTWTTREGNHHDIFVSDTDLYEESTGDGKVILKEKYKLMQDERDRWFAGGSVGPEPRKYYLEPDVDEVGYWRKANQIHGWFVTHCQDGVDDCQFTPVHHEQLKGLYDLCIQIASRYAAGSTDLEEYITSELPPTAGFFFGGYEIDDWYFQDIQNTIEILEPLLSNPPTPLNPYCLAYTSSW